MNSIQRLRLRHLLADAWHNVTMYRALYEASGLSERDLAEREVLSRLPILTKAQLLATPQEERVNRRFRRSELTMESTTGSTGQPFSLYIDSRYRLLRNLRFLHGLFSAGYRPWHRMLLLTDRYDGLKRKQNRYYQSVEQPATEILEAYLRIRPQVLYGFTTPLRMLAETIRKAKTDVPRPRLVVSTAEMLDPAARESLSGTFGCPVTDFYGLTEMGLVAWERPGTDGYVLSSFGVITELVPDHSCPGRYRLLMTNLDLRGSPVIRFDAGDLAHAVFVDGKPRIRSFEGRLIDTLLTRDGREISPYRVTDALRDIPGLKRFRILQQTCSALDVALEIDSAAARSEAIRQIRNILEKLLGPELQLNFSFSDQLIPVGATKFRPVESRVLRPMGDLSQVMS